MPTVAQPTLQLACWLLIAILVLGAIGFSRLQNRLGMIGGEIALPKAAWLMLAIFMWLGLPLLLVLDARSPHFLGSLFGFIFISMALRGIIELWMLYGPKNWSPAYGIAHDVFCMLGMGAYWLLGWQAGEVAQAPMLALHGVVSTLLFIPEIWFAWYMRKHFHTKGGDAIYFVPDEEKHRRVLRVTASVDIMLLLYLPVFLHSWFHV